MSIRNFRGINELDIELLPFTVLIGENNAGKSSILEAVRICLDKVPAKRGYIFSQQDLQQGSKQKILLRCTIQISTKHTGYPGVCKKLGAALQIVKDSDNNLLILEVEGTWNDTTGQSSHTPRFLNTELKPH